MKNTRFIKIFLSIIILILLPVSLLAFDFGLTANIYTGYGNDQTEENEFDFKANLWPRLTLLIDDNAEFFVSFGLSVDKNKNPVFIPELLRTEFSMRFGNAGFKVGRINYSDPLSFIASGLFDGVHCYLNSNMGRFSAGAWYTGLLYKETANITMTKNDQDIYGTLFEYDKFSETYFAPEKLIASLEWNHPSIGELLNLNAAAVFQYDFFNEAGQYHNQYIIIKAGLPINSFFLELGGAVEFSQEKTDKGVESNAAFAGDFVFSWLPQTAANSRLSLNFKIAGGKDEDGKFTAFTPITTNYFGNILQIKMSGLSLLGLNYTMRISREIGTAITASYFIRNDLGTVRGYPVKEENQEEKVYFLGPEIFARLIWSPLSDTQFNLGAGAFFPMLGNAGPDEAIRWRVELSATLSLY